MGKCPNCGAPMESSTCAYCNYSKPIEQENSSGSVIINNNVYATSNVGYVVEYVSPKSKLLALVLCFFLGVFGGHCFYVGRIGRGLLFFFTMGLFGLGWLADMVFILVNRFTDANDLPVSKW